MKTGKMNRPLAYKDDKFLDSEAARPVRILAEYLQPLEVFRRVRILAHPVSRSGRTNCWFPCPIC